MIKTNLYFLRRPTISPEHKKAEVSTPPKQPLTQIVDTPAAKEEKSPVICRVSKKSEKDAYHMYDKYMFCLLIGLIIFKVICRRMYYDELDK